MIEHDNANDIIVIKAHPPIYIMFSVLFSLPFFFSIFNTIQNSTKWPGIIIIVFILICIYAWLRGYKITLQGDVFSFKLPFSRMIALRICEIKNVDFKLGRIINPTGSIFEHSITIYRFENALPIVINTKPFSKSDIEKIYHFLRDKSVAHS